MKIRQHHVLVILTLYICFVFIQSLFFKYSNSPETQHIFGTLDQWAGTFGLAGLFAPSGIFSQYVIGTAELLASGILLFGLIRRNNLMHAFGAIISMAVISGAICFHLFTPLGVVIDNDGGLLFAMACGIWLSAAYIIYTHKCALLALIKRIMA